MRTLGFEIDVRNHAEAILSVDFSSEVRELVDALVAFSLTSEEIVGSGGGEAASTQRLRRQLADAGWRKHNFVIETKIDGETREATTHEIDHVRRGLSGTIALEIEWNNKDPFFDRDLENFQRLHAQSAVSCGVVVTRGSSLQAAMRDIVADLIRRRGFPSETEMLELGMKDRTVRQREAVERAMFRGAEFADAFSHHFVADKFGMATTHWSKLADRINRGVGNPCPLLLIGLPVSCVSDYSAATPEL